MKYEIFKPIVILFLNLICLVTFGQTAVNQIDASLTSTGNTATVLFKPNSTFDNSGESSTLKIWLKLPATQTSSATVTMTYNPYNLALVQSSVNGADRIYQYQAIFNPAFQYSNWSIDMPVNIATFQVTNFTGPSLQVGLATFGFSGSSWNGTSINRIVAGNYNNLVTWPITSTTLLPIKLTAFSAEQYGASSSKLDWTTSSEENSDFFGIERSEDGVNWSAIGKVRAAGNSSETLKYQFIDSNLPMNRSKNQIFYYRLRMTDLDGKFEYSDIRGVNFSRSSDWVVKIYPNPTAELINVDLSGMDLEAGEINLSVFDNNARQVISKKVIGNGIELIDVTRLPAGMYNVMVRQGSTLHKERIIKID